MTNRHIRPNPWLFKFPPFFYPQNPPPLKEVIIFFSYYISFIDQLMYIYTSMQAIKLFYLFNIKDFNEVKI